MRRRAFVAAWPDKGGVSPLVGSANGRLSKALMKAIHDVLGPESYARISSHPGAAYDRLSVRWLILDEVSGYLRDVDGRGSPSSQARARQKAFGDLAKELALSTPGMAGECEISGLYDPSDRRRFYIPCPHCGDYGLLKYDKMLAPSPATANRAAFVCEGFGGRARGGPQRPDGGRWAVGAYLGCR